MSRPQTTITLPVARAAQLQELATIGGTTVAELIEQLINREIEAGRLSDTLPGFAIRITRRRVHLTIPDGFELPAVAASQARQIADVLEAVAARGAGKALIFDHGVSLKVARIGRGVVVMGEEPSGKQAKASMTPMMARDLARQLRAAADRAE